MPRSLDVIVRDETVERCKPGDKVKITGCLIVVPDVPSMMNPSELKRQDRKTIKTRSDSSFSSDGVRGLKGMGNRDLTYKMSFYGTYVEEDSYFSMKSAAGFPGDDRLSGGKLCLSPSDKKKFNNIKNHVDVEGRKDCFKVVSRAIAPAVQGHDDVKKGILLMLIGGLKKQTEEGIRLRGDLNVCLLGDPATAKSVFLKWVSAFCPRGVYASGKTSTAAGLTASVTKDFDLDKEKVIEPGALMLADNGVCCIDEFELMDAKDQVAIHEAMEQQTITLSKAGIQATLNARTSILAACLPKNTRYQPTIPLHKNVDMSPPILSRFDLMFVMQDIFDPATDSRVAEHIMALHRGKERKKKDEDDLSPMELARYIATAKEVEPKMNKASHEQLVRCYRRLRDDKSSDRGAAGVTVRQLESLIRLSEAVARVHLDPEVKVEYVLEAFRLQTDTMNRAEKETIDLAPDVGEVDAEPTPGPDDTGGAPAAPAAARKRKITYADYTRMGHLLGRYLQRQEDDANMITEEELMVWYMDQKEEDFESEAQLLEEQALLQLVINRMVDKDRVLLVARTSDDASHPERRVLVKHPNWDTSDGRMRAGNRRQG